MKSMTGFGRGTHSTATWQATVEVSAVNRKQREIVVQLPREFQELEPRIRKIAEPLISRGRIQASINLTPVGDAQGMVTVDESLAKELCKAFERISEITGKPVSPGATDFLNQPGLIEIAAGKVDPGDAWEALEPAVRSALSSLLIMREAEGQHLKEDLLERISTIEHRVDEVGRVAPERPIKQRELLLKRLADAGLDLDPSDERVMKEIALFADRCDITEELTRLTSHVIRFRDYLSSTEATGRPLDFLCQEIFRELNTIGSKANDSGIAQTIVEAKAELEKIREQVQNIE